MESILPRIPNEKLKLIRDLLRSQKQIQMRLAITKVISIEDNDVVECSQSLQFSEHGKPTNRTTTVTLYLVKRAKGWQIADMPIS